MKTLAQRVNSLALAVKRILNDIGDISHLVRVVNGKIPSHLLPSYIDEILEFDNTNDFPQNGEFSKLYNDLENNLFYRWSGSTYALIGDGTAVDVLGIGATAFARYDISQSLTDAQKSQILTNIGAKRTGNLINKSASYTLELSDFQSAVDLYDLVCLRMNSASATNITINTSLSSLPNLTRIEVRNVGTGLSTLVASGTTLNGNLAFTAQHEVKSIVKVGLNEWDVVGVLP